MKKLLKSVKPSPVLIAVLVLFGIAVWAKIQTPTFEERVEAYFGATMLFIGWCFERLWKATPSGVSDEQRDKLAAEWERQVKRAQYDLAKYMRLVSLQGKHWREWNEQEKSQFSEYFQGCELKWLSKLAHEFKTEDRRAWLRKRWECVESANKDEIPIPSNSELWEIKGE